MDRFISRMRYYSDLAIEGVMWLSCGACIVAALVAVIEGKPIGALICLPFAGVYALIAWGLRWLHSRPWWPGGQ